MINVLLNGKHDQRKGSCSCKGTVFSKPQKHKKLRSSNMPISDTNGIISEVMSHDQEAARQIK